MRTVRTKAPSQFQAPHVSLAKDSAYALDPVLFAKACAGITPDPVQERILTSTSKRLLLNLCRQAGKSTTASILALHQSLYSAPATVVLVSPSMQQSVELFRKIHSMWENLENAPEAEQESLTRMQLSNGSRIISYPGNEKTVRGLSANLVLADEASRIPDELRAAVTPMLATKADGRFVAMSTPAGKRGWFYESWMQSEGWEKISVRASEVARISPDFLKEELAALGPLRFAEEYECQFIDSDTSAFSSELIEQVLVGNDEFELF